MFKIRVFTGHEYYRKPQHNVPNKVFGSEYGGHCVALNHLTKGSIVYSAGLGYDISFDEELILEYGLDVHGFDPTPDSIKHLKKSL